VSFCPIHSILACLDEDSHSNFIQYLTQRHSLHPEFLWGLLTQNSLLQSMDLILILTRLSEVCPACLWHQSTKCRHCSRNTLCLGIEIIKRILKMQVQVVKNSISFFLLIFKQVLKRHSEIFLPSVPFPHKCHSSWLCMLVVWRWEHKGQNNRGCQGAGWNIHIFSRPF